MTLGELSIAEVAEHPLTHAIRLADLNLPKGRFLDETEIQRLRQAGSGR